MDYSPNSWMSGAMGQQKPRKQVQEFNDVFRCYLCHGYLINPTTITSCMHSYCRSCIVQYIQVHHYCPQCKTGGGKQISWHNLKTDEALRDLIFKLVPGLYQQERERMLQFSGKTESNNQPQRPSEDVNDVFELDERYFAPAEPISLSLEYHPALLSTCSADEIPPVRYLQCPAGIMIHHLKRFLCSKYEIDPENKQVEIEIIYEDEILADDFTLMDVGYCYNWKRVGPMRFTYRILIHSGTTQDIAEIQLNAGTEIPPTTNTLNEKRLKKSISMPEDHSHVAHKTVRFADNDRSISSKLDDCLPPPMTYTVFKSKAQEYRLGALNNNNNKLSTNNSIEHEYGGNDCGNGPVKVIIARKPVEGKKHSPKRSHSSDETTYAVSNDFKSLRSNDLRYSDYTVTSTTNSSSSNGGKSKQKTLKTDAQADEQKHKVPKCDIFVSIPQSQLPRSPNSSDETVTLSQLKTANKKSPPSAYSGGSSSRNVPKLKIELGSLKTKITIPKPKSADISLPKTENKKSKHRKYSVDDYRPVADRVDLATYAKHIGLKPIEVVTAADNVESVDKDKCSPDASPMSSSSSTTSSSNGNFVFTSSSEITSSSHKKRKKKHSRDSKDSNGKRRKLHAEISSQSADESLKMKVKFTASHNHKTHKLESRKQSYNNDEVVKEQKAEIKKSDAHSRPAETVLEGKKEQINSQTNINNNNKIGVNLMALNQTLSEESTHINNLVVGPASPLSSVDAPKTTTSSLTTLSKPMDSLLLSPKPLIPKPLSSIKDIKIPSSPPLPPSLFKTTPLTLTTSTAPTTAATVKTSPKSVSSFVAKPAQKINTKPSSPVQLLNQTQAAALPPPSSLVKTNNHAKTQNFAVPNPPRSMPTSPKLSALPTSIASSANKHVGANLKRSASLDETYPPHCGLTKIQQERINRKPSYGGLVGPSPLRVSSAPKKTPSHTITKTPMPHKYASEPTKRKAPPGNMVATSVCVSKASDAITIYSNPRMSTQPTLTITTHPKQTAAQQMINFLPYPASLNKPAMEIMRVTSNQIPADKLPLPLIGQQKPVRPTQPPIPLLKIKKPGQQTFSSSSSPPSAHSPAVTLQNLSPKTTSPMHGCSVNMRNTIPLSITAKTVGNDTKEKSVESKVNGNTLHEKPKKSLRDFRPTCKDGSVEILDLSASKPQDTLKTSDVPTLGNSLEAALNKIKQNITSCTVSDSLQAGKNNAAKSNNDDLQNLHLLSESATNREKIAIKPATQLFEMPKLQQQPMVRQQNASVRNIPNPSALAFRNQPTSLSMLTTATSPTALGPPQQNPPSPVAPCELKALSPPSTLFVSSPKSPNPASNQISPRTKKLTSIDQVAATLNIRAAAAEAEAAKAASTEEPALVSSTSTTAEQQSVSAGDVVLPAVGSANVSSSATISSTTTTTSKAVPSSDTPQIVVNYAATTSTVTATAAPTSPAIQKTSFKNISSLVAPTSAVVGSV